MTIRRFIVTVEEDAAEREKEIIPSITTTSESPSVPAAPPVSEVKPPAVEISVAVAADASAVHEETVPPIGPEVV